MCLHEKLATPNTNNTDSIAYTYPATSFVEILISGLATMWHTYASKIRVTIVICKVFNFCRVQYSFFWWLTNHLDNRLDALCFICKSNLTYPATATNRLIGLSSTSDSMALDANDNCAITRAFFWLLPTNTITIKKKPAEFLFFFFLS